jgi:2'-5' RNA ligase
VGDVSDAGYLSTRLATIRFPIFDVAFDDFYLRDSFFCLRVKSPYLSYLRKEITKIIPAQGKFFPHVTLAEHVEEIDEVLPLAENEQVTCFQLYNTRHGKYHLLGQYNLG